MSLALDTKPTLESISQLERAILETLTYSDIFEYPLTLDELHRFLSISATKTETQKCIIDMKNILSIQGYFFLAGRSEIVDIRKQREENSRKAYCRAMFYGRIMGKLPFIRMVALTGSLAMLNLSKNRDMDYMLVAKPGRVWTARAFALLLGRLARLFGDIICPNVIVSENALEWNARNLYTAREFAQMIPISGAGVFNRLRVVNLWVKDILPNHVILSEAKDLSDRNTTPNIFEFLLNNKLGDRFESWEMNRKIARFKNQKGYGLETNFSADVCQGNFDHHGSWAMMAYEERLRTLSLLGEGRPRADDSSIAHRVEAVREEP